MTRNMLKKNSNNNNNCKIYMKMNKIQVKNGTINKKIFLHEFYCIIFKYKVIYCNYLYGKLIIIKIIINKQFSNS